MFKLIDFNMKLPLCEEKQCSWIFLELSTIIKLALQYLFVRFRKNTTWLTLKWKIFHLLTIIYNKVSIHINLLTRTICLCSNPTLPFHQEVLHILLQPSRNWQPRILAYGSLIEMALLISMLAQAKVYMFWLALTIVDNGLNYDTGQGIKTTSTYDYNQ
ncbi:unnamed protein product, partial [Vitis vinifera]